MKNQIFLSVGFLTMIATAFTNCGQDVNFNQLPALGGAGLGTPNAEILENCRNAKATSRLQVLNENVVFADTRVESGRAQVCEWNVNDNLDKVNDKNQARYEQNHRLGLPEKAVVCDVKMTVQRQRIVYDDVFLLSYNGRLIASNDNTAVMSHLTPEAAVAASNGQSVDLFKADWLQFRGSPFQNSDRDDYCLGKEQGLGSCQWPLTQIEGDFAFEFAPELLVDIGKRESPTNQVLGFSVTGDNDAASDCYHSPINFDVKVEYYISN